MDHPPVESRARARFRQGVRHQSAPPSADSAASSAGGFYPVRLTQERTPGGEVWIAEHTTLRGCRVTGGDRHSALDALDRARVSWIERARAEGRPVPPPGRDFRCEMVFAAGVADAVAGETGGTPVRTSWI